MFLRKLFWSIGGKLPVWLVHPGQIILALERKLGATLFKGATLPAWWMPEIVPGVIVTVGVVAALAIAITGTFWYITKIADEIVATSVTAWIFFAKPVGSLFVGGLVFGMTGRLATIWPWRHLRVAVCTVEDERAACKIAREPCAFEHFDGSLAKKYFVHWFWGPTLGSRDWKFRFTTHAQVGEETSHSFMVVSDQTGESMSFTIHEMTDTESIHPWRGRCLHGAHEGQAMNWFDLLYGLLMSHSQKLADSKESVARLSAELRLARIEAEAWSELIGMHLAFYLESGRTTRPDKEIGRRLRDLAIDVVGAYMQHVRGLGVPGHHPDKLEELFAAMNWPPLVSARKRRAPGTHTALVEPVEDDLDD